MASIQCGHCGGTHRSVAEARACAGADRQSEPTGGAEAAPARPPRRVGADLRRVAGPSALGRNVVVRPGQPVPAPWADAPRITVEPGAPVPDVLRDRWYDRRRTVIELVEPLPERSAAHGGPVWHLDPTLLVEADILEHLVWSNSVDLRDPDRPAYRWLDAAVAVGRP